MSLVSAQPVETNYGEENQRRMQRPVMEQAELTLEEREKNIQESRELLYKWANTPLKDVPYGVLCDIAYRI